MHIELIPSVEKSSIKHRLTHSLQTCDFVKGAVAYWTIDINFIPELSKKLKHPNSFYCIDFHKPTNIDYLARFKKDGANIFLHNYELVNNRENSDILQAAKIPYLLHSKIILFVMHEEVEIWLGSHNFTRRAISGLNIESSFIVRTNKSTSLYKDVDRYLEFIKKNCIEFDLQDIEFYKKLQGDADDTGEWVLELIGKNVLDLKQNKAVTLLGLDNEDTKNRMIDSLRTDSILYLHILDVEKDEEYVYKSKIRQIGDLNSNIEKSTDMDFYNRKLILKIANLFPYLFPDSIDINPKILKKYQYFANIQILEYLNKAKVFKKPQRSKEIWQYLKNESNHFLRMNQADQALFSFVNIKQSSQQEIPPKLVSLIEKMKNHKEQYVNMYETMFDPNDPGKFFTTVGQQESNLPKKFRTDSTLTRCLIENNDS